MSNSNELLTAIMTLRKFAPASQIAALLEGIRGEEGEFFKAKINEMAERITTMPKTYDQDGKGNEAVVHLHYFKGSCDWYITERDVETPDEPGQHQAFGLADFGYGGELGYISIVELIRNGVELDLYWNPVTLGAVKSKYESRVQAYENQGLTRSDAQGVVEAEDMKAT